MSLLRWLINFPTWTPDCDSQSHSLLDLFISSDASICSTMDHSRKNPSSEVEDMEFPGVLKKEHEEISVVN